MRREFTGHFLNLAKSDPVQKRQAFDISVKGFLFPRAFYSYDV